MSSLEALQSIYNDISSGFDILLKRLEEQRKSEVELRQQLARAIEKFNSNSSDSPSDGAFSSWQDEIVKQISFTPVAEQDLQLEVLQGVKKAREAIAKLKPSMSHAPAQKCPVAHSLTPVAEEMEKDFTTTGKPSSLECPYAKMSKNGPVDAASQRDPIAAEFHQDSLSAQSLDEARACGKCPIRFLDQHSPEEIAQYFENHKHEIPRSHEVCVKRFGQNESSIRQLDAKYGNIVSMIQGLGNKHKQYLRSEEQERPQSADEGSGAAVENWANHVGNQTNEEGAEVADEQRLSHFDKPLRVIRVGESPTRPWGISVPVDRQAAGSRVPSNQDSSPKSPSTRPKSEVKDIADVLPTTTPAEGSSRRSRSHASTRTSNRQQQSTIIFNGPVVLGYSAEQAAAFLQQLGSANGNLS